MGLDFRPKSRLVRIGGSAGHQRRRLRLQARFLLLQVGICRQRLGVRGNHLGPLIGCQATRGTLRGGGRGRRRRRSTGLRLQLSGTKTGQNDRGKEERFHRANVA